MTGSTEFHWDTKLPGDAHSLLLGGIVGSTAYGLATPASDIDRLGVYALRSELLFGLRGVSKSKHKAGDAAGDFTVHEAGRYAHFALGCNPHVLELLWLPDELYEVRHPPGDDLIALRECFLWRDRVRDAYLGYVSSQFGKLETRGDNSFSADTRKRTAKHARHLLRLCEQGFQLYATGKITVRLSSPELYHSFGDIVAAGDIAYARRTISTFEELFNRTRSALPLRPNQTRVEQWLTKVRYSCLRDFNQ